MSVGNSFLWTECEYIKWFKCKKWIISWHWSGKCFPDASGAALAACLTAHQLQPGRTGV